MKSNRIRQGLPIDIELENRQLLVETVHYRVESGLYMDQPSRIISPSDHRLPPAIHRWFELRTQLSHPCLPTLLRSTAEPTWSQGPIVEQWTGQKTLRALLEADQPLMSELTAVYLTLQAATTLDFLIQSGADTPRLSENDFVVDDHSNGLPRLYFIGWYPPELEQEGSWEEAGLRFLARLLYRCLTGSLPPSEQVSLEAPDLEDSDLGFDDLFLTWIADERDLSTLGQAAMSALKTDAADYGIQSFIREVYPHLRKATNEAIEEAVVQLGEDRLLLADVETHRQQLKELRTRQQYLKGWLLDHEPLANQVTQNFETENAYLTQVSAFSNDLRSRLSEDLKRRHLTPSSPILMSKASPDVIESSAEQNGEPSLMDLADQIEQDVEAFQPTLDTPSASIQEEPEAEHRDETVSSTAAASSARLILLIIFMATILGVLFAWSLLAKPIQNNVKTVEEIPQGHTP